MKLSLKYNLILMATLAIAACHDATPETNDMPEAGVWKASGTFKGQRRPVRRHRTAIQDGQGPRPR